MRVWRFYSRVDDVSQHMTSARTGPSGWIDPAEAMSPLRRSPSANLGTTRCGRVCKKLRIRVHGPNPRDQVHDGNAWHWWLSSLLPRPHSNGVFAQLPKSEVEDAALDDDYVRGKRFEIGRIEEIELQVGPLAENRFLVVSELMPKENIVTFVGQLPSAYVPIGLGLARRAIWRIPGDLRGRPCRFSPHSQRRR